METAMDLQQWTHVVRIIFGVPNSYLIPDAEMAQYVWLLKTEKFPVLARVMDCQTTVDCICYHCKLESQDC